MLPFKTAEKLIFRPVKIDRLLVLYCYRHNRAHQASVVLLLLELFSIQAHVISQDLHFFGRNNFHETVFKALCQKQLVFTVQFSSVQKAVQFYQKGVWCFPCFSGRVSFELYRFRAIDSSLLNRISSLSLCFRIDSGKRWVDLCTKVTPLHPVCLWHFRFERFAETLHTIH